MALLRFLLHGRCRRSFRNPSCGRFFGSKVDPALVQASGAPSGWESSSAVVYPDVITEQQAAFLEEFLNSKFQRKRYQKGHWDSAIQNYKETELFDEPDDVKAILAPIRKIIEESHSSSPVAAMNFTGTWLPCHAIDLHQDGRLNPHVDSVRYSGNIVSGLSLLSDSVMRLKPEKEQSACGEESSQQHFIDLILPQRSLYVLSGTARYEFTHEILPDCPQRRLSIIFRDAKE